MSMHIRRAPNRGPVTTDHWFGVGAAALVAVAVAWLAAAAGVEGAAVLSGKASVRLGAPQNAFAMLLQRAPGTPAAQLGPPVLMWTITALVATGCGWPASRLTVRIWRWAIGNDRYKGQASASQLQGTCSPRAVLREASRIRPSLVGSIAVADVAVRVGESARDGSPVWMSLQNNLGLIAAPQTGKTSSTMGVLPIHFPGPAIMTETHRPDLLAMSACQPDFDRPVLVQDPENRVGWPDPVGIDVLAGCEDHGVAYRRASLLVRAATARSDTPLSGNIEFFIGEATSAACAFLHAARLGDAGLGAVLRWTQRWGSEQPVEILQSERGSAEAQSDAQMLRELYAVSGPQAAGTAGELRNAFACLIDPDVVRTFGGGHRHTLDVGGFLDARARLYIVGSGREQRSIGPFVALVISEIVEEALTRAARAPGRRLDPPLLLDLDELANIAPLPDLTYYLSAGTGSGVCTAWAVQALEQLRNRWGLHAAREILQSTNWRVWFGGSVEAQDLREMQDLCGEVYEETLTRQRPDWLDFLTGSRYPDRYGTQLGLQRVPMLTAEQLRTLPKGHAVLLARNLPATELVMRPWWERREVAPLIRESQRRFARLIGVPAPT